MKWPHTVAASICMTVRFDHDHKTSVTPLGSDGAALALLYLETLPDGGVQWH